MDLKKVCLDAQIYIWGIKKESIPEQKQMIDLAERFIDYLEKKEQVYANNLRILFKNGFYKRLR